MSDLRKLDASALLQELVLLGGIDCLYRIGSLSVDLKEAARSVSFEWQPRHSRSLVTRCLASTQLLAPTQRFSRLTFRLLALHLGEEDVGTYALHNMLTISSGTLRLLCLYDCTHQCSMIGARSLHLLFLEHGFPPHLFSLRLGGGLGG